MRKLLIGAVAAASVLTAAPAFAQVGFYAGENGVGVRVGPQRDYYRDRDRWDYRGDRGWRRGYYRSHAECRDVTVRRRLPDGSVVVRRSRTC